MSAIAYHECYNLSLEERWLTMEAFYNRIKINFNNNGMTVREQLLAPKQFTGLWKYNSHRFKFDSKDEICNQNKVMAEAIITGSRLSNELIVYWASKKHDKTTQHWKNIVGKSLDLPKHFKQIYSR